MLGTTALPFALQLRRVMRLRPCRRRAKDEGEGGGGGVRLEKRPSLSQCVVRYLGHCS